MGENYKDKRRVSELFDVPIKTLNNDLTEMRRTEFNVHILRPSHKRVYINVERYKAFLKYKQKLRESSIWKKDKSNIQI
ncbi:DNA-binding protein [Lactococcus lactis]|jgi:hypothetical protein|uniref:DNA-binding protein n=1 Tax=Lactococcus lactis TaxID=1358 RepID=UPI002061E305|nr:DNA-binding protein [Lactococcus lactis]WKF73833.1 DNA-binding protein [Lactococcus lactis]BDH80968.1 hypothetical protein LLL8_06250 [Lactococcus lactis]